MSTESQRGQRPAVFVVDVGAEGDARARVDAVEIAGVREGGGEHGEEERDALFDEAEGVTKLATLIARFAAGSALHKQNVLRTELGLAVLQPPAPLGRASWQQQPVPEGAQQADFGHRVFELLSARFGLAGDGVEMPPEGRRAGGASPAAVRVVEFEE